MRISKKTYPFELDVPGDEELKIYGRVHLPEEDSDKLPLVMIVPGFLGFMDWGFYPFIARELVKNGIAALMFNHSTGGVGRSGKPYSSLTSLAKMSIQQDMDDMDLIRSALERNEITAAERIDLSSIGLIGHSKGGGISILHSHYTGGIKAIVSINGAADFLRVPKEKIDKILRDGYKERQLPGTKVTIRIDKKLWEQLVNNPEKYDVIKAAEDNEACILLLHAEDDEIVPFTESGSVYEANPAKNEIRLIKNSDHLLKTKPFVLKLNGRTRGVIEEAVQWIRDSLSGEC